MGFIEILLLFLSIEYPTPCYGDGNFPINGIKSNCVWLHHLVVWSTQVLLIDFLGIRVYFNRFP